MKNEEGNRMRSEQGAESNVQEKMNNEKAKTCFDCLHCKVSAQSTLDCRLLYCSQTLKKSKHKISYWLTKQI
jgi:hypothetical protein